MAVPASRGRAQKSPVKKIQANQTRNRYTIREKITAMKWCARKVSEENWSQHWSCGETSLSDAESDDTNEENDDCNCAPV